MLQTDKDNDTVMCGECFLQHIMKEGRRLSRGQDRLEASNNIAMRFRLNSREGFVLTVLVVLYYSLRKF